MRPEHYARIVRDARSLLDRIEAGCAPQTSAQRKGLTVAVYRLGRLVRELMARHSAQIGADGAWREEAAPGNQRCRVDADE